MTQPGEHESPQFFSGIEAWGTPSPQQGMIEPSQDVVAFAPEDTDDTVVRTPPHERVFTIVDVPEDDDFDIADIEPVFATRIYDEDESVDDDFEEPQVFVDPVVSTPRNVSPNQIPQAGIFKRIGDAREARTKARLKQQSDAIVERQEALARLNLASDQRLTQESVRLSPVIQYPIAVAPGEQFHALVPQDAMDTRIAKFLNDEMVNKVQREVMALPGIKPRVEFPNDMLDMNHDEHLARDTVRSILEHAQRQIEASERRELDQELDTRRRDSLTTKIVGTAENLLTNILRTATDSVIINPYPDTGETHAVYAALQIQSQVGLSDQELRVDANYQQPVVMTRVICTPDGTTIVDATMNGIEKVYDKFGTQSTYELDANGRVNPLQMLGLVVKQPSDSYDGNFIVHMRDGGIRPDHTYTASQHAGNTAYILTQEITPYHVTAEVYSKIQAYINQALAETNMWLDKTQNPLALGEVAARLQGHVVVPVQQGIVDANMQAIALANKAHADKFKEGIANIQEETTQRLQGIAKMVTQLANNSGSGPLQLGK